jgi:hypothetical protein
LRTCLEMKIGERVHGFTPRPRFGVNRRAPREGDMKRWGVLAVALGLALAGCQSEEDSFYNAPKPLDKMSPEEVCTFYQHYLSNPELSPSNKAIATEQLRAKHCAS